MEGASMRKLLASVAVALAAVAAALTLGSGPAHADVCDTCHFLGVEFGNGGLAFLTG
jgi:hypothetical protein